MAKLILDGKKLSQSIARVLGARAKMNVELHLLASSAIMLAVKDGRCNWLNDLYSGLDSMSQDSFRAWVAPNAPHWFGKDVATENKWIRFESKGQDGKTPRGFYIAEKTKRPDLGHVDRVADDLTCAFFNKRAQSTVDTNKGFDLEAFVSQFEKLAARMEKLVKEETIVLPTRAIQHAMELAAEIKAGARLKLVTVDGKPVDNATKAEEVRATAKVKARNSGDAAKVMSPVEAEQSVRVSA